MISTYRTAPNRTAHVAGLIYLVIVLIAPYRLIYVPNTLFVAGDAAATVAGIASHETLFRLGIAADLICGATMVFLVLTLYRLFEDVDRGLARCMLILGGIFVPTGYFFNVLNDAAALFLVRGADFMGAAFDQPQRDAMAMLFLRLHGMEVSAAQLLWGLWLIPLAMLVLRSGFLPRVLGYGLVLNGLAYVVQALAWAMLPDLRDTLAGVLGPLQFVEVLFMLWLLVFGARPGFRRPKATPLALTDN